MLSADVLLLRRHDLDIPLRIWKRLLEYRGVVLVADDYADGLRGFWIDGRGSAERILQIIEWEAWATQVVLTTRSQ